MTAGSPASIFAWMISEITWGRTFSRATSSSSVVGFISRFLRGFTKGLLITHYAIRKAFVDFPGLVRRDRFQVFPFPRAHRDEVQEEPARPGQVEMSPPARNPIGRVVIGGYQGRGSRIIPDSINNSYNDDISHLITMYITL